MYFFMKVHTTYVPWLKLQQAGGLCFLFSFMSMFIRTQSHLVTAYYPQRTLALEQRCAQSYGNPEGRATGDCLRIVKMLYILSETSWTPDDYMFFLSSAPTFRWVLMGLKSLQIRLLATTSSAKLTKGSAWSSQPPPRYTWTRSPQTFASLLD